MKISINYDKIVNLFSSFWIWQQLTNPINIDLIMEFMHCAQQPIMSFVKDVQSNSNGVVIWRLHRNQSIRMCNSMPQNATNKLQLSLIRAFSHLYSNGECELRMRFVTIVSVAKFSDRSDRTWYMRSHELGRIAVMQPHWMTKHLIYFK